MKIFSRLIIFAFFITLLSAEGVRASEAPKKEKVDSIPLKGYIYDRLTTREVVNTDIFILNPDSSFVSYAKGGEVFWNLVNGTVREDSTSYFEIFLPRRKGDYIIKVSKEGYNDLYAPYHADFGSRTSELKAPKLYLGRQKVMELEEVTVKTSKIKVYHKGDTIVYNADAFNLPEGSMLEALVQQMPGVEIKDNNIYVNGKYVESLLLNGKEFFKGDPSVAMKNIGAYTVKDVAVYERNDESAALLGNRDDVEKEYVMDVHLKKDYMAGTAVNAEAGYGINDRYIGRLFTLGYTNNTRVSLYGNANNMNISNRLDENGEQYSTIDDSGITTRANGGIDYNFDNALHTWEVNGNTDVHYTDVVDGVTTNSFQYIQTAENFLFSDKNSRLKSLTVSTNNEIKLNREQWNLRIQPNFYYNKDKNHSDTRSATFDKEFEGMNKDIISNLYKPDYTTFTEALINRNIELYDSRSHGYKGEVSLASKIKIPNSPDALELKGNVSYNRSTDWGSTLQDIAFGDQSGDGLNPVSSLLQQRDQNIRPSYDLYLKGLARYYFNLPFGSLNASYEYVHNRNRKNSSLMLLESMAQGTMAEFQPGQLPMPDFANSYMSKSFKNTHHVKLIWRLKKKFEKGTFEVSVEPSIYLERHDLYYTQGDAYVDPKRTFWKYELGNTYVNWSPDNNKYRLYLSYQIDQETPDLLKMVDIPNTTDPMNIWLGNPDLKKTTSHNFVLGIYGQPSRHNWYSVTLLSDIRRNAFANGYIYESSTGIRRMKTYNVKGESNFSLGATINQDLDKAGRWQLRNTFHVMQNNYVNMIGYDVEPRAQKVNSWNLLENLNISYDTKLMTISAGCYYNWRKANNSVNTMTKDAYGTIIPAFSVRMKLPFGLNLYARYDVKKYYGYNDPSMNRWEGNLGGSLIYTMLGDKLSFVLRVNDLLNQQTGLSMRVDATSRTQLQSLMLGRTILFSIGYKFQIAPKRR